MSKKTKLSTASLLVMAMISSNFALAADKVDIQADSGAQASNISITQAGAGNAVGSAAAPFVANGGWSALSISQNAGATGGNAVSGKVDVGTSGAVGNTLALNQVGNSNNISLDVGKTNPSSTSMAISISQAGDGNNSSLNLDNLTGVVSVTETTIGNSNAVSVSAKNGVNYSSNIALLGNNNTVGVARDGGFSAATDLASISGNLNNLSVSGNAGGSVASSVALTGSGNNFTLTQTGANANAVVSVAANQAVFNVNQTSPGAQLALRTTSGATGGTFTVRQ